MFPRLSKQAHHAVLSFNSGAAAPGLMRWCLCAPAQCAFIGKFLDIQKLLFSAGAKVYRKGIGLVECQISR